jgi:hypothetical protein
VPPLTSVEPCSGGVVTDTDSVVGSLSSGSLSFARTGMFTAAPLFVVALSGRGWGPR